MKIVCRFEKARSLVERIEKKKKEMMKHDLEKSTRKLFMKNWPIAGLFSRGRQRQRNDDDASSIDVSSGSRAAKTNRALTQM